MSGSSTPPSAEHAPFEVARLGAFVDAVVAIAMTLLMLFGGPVQNVFARLAVKRQR